MSKKFIWSYKEEIDIEVPILYVDYEKLTEDEQALLHMRCEKISAEIPIKIKNLEKRYIQLHKSMTTSDHDDHFFEIMDQLNELSRLICELNVWYLKMQGKHLTSVVHG